MQNVIVCYSKFQVVEIFFYIEILYASTNREETRGTGCRQRPERSVYLVIKENQEERETELFTSVEKQQTSSRKTISKS